MRGNTTSSGGKEGGAPASVLVDGYDRLTVRQIRRQLDFLLDSEIRVLRRYEAAHKRRKTLLRVIDRRLGNQQQ